METLLQPGRNVWRLEHAARAAVLLDGADFFAAVRAACLKAQRSIFIAGWDIDSRTPLVGADHVADDGYPDTLAAFLSALVEERPNLNVYLLLWDYSLVYLPEREMFPRLSLAWTTPSRITLCLDDAVPVGSSQHQKLVVVDDTLAFSGGLDLTIRRWDTSEHHPHNPRRLDSAGVPYPPFHDVQMMVDGDAALALAELVRRRWCHAEGTEPPLDPVGDPWPQHVTPDFCNVGIGIARTQPAFGEQQAVEEVRQLFFDAIDRAEHSIYIENQFVSSLEIAKRLARRLRERPELEVLVVSPHDYDSMLVTQTLGEERVCFLRILENAGGERVRFVAPRVQEGRHTADTMVHSKVMVVDDWLLRIGSANLNNRSLGVDTECDLVIEAQSEAERAAIAAVRARLIGDHCGVSPEEVADCIAQNGSLLAVVDRLRSRSHELVPIGNGRKGRSWIAAVLHRLVDPRHPLQLTKWVVERLPSSRTAWLLAGIGAVLLAMTLAWQFTPLSQWVSLERAQGLLAAQADSGWSFAWVVGLFVIASLVAFPVTVLIVATAATFGPWVGFFYACAGVLASAFVNYFAGMLIGKDLLRSILGKRLDKIRDQVGSRGVLAVAAIRLVPVAPFTVVNLTAGAFSIALIDFMAGTLMGTLPGLIGLSMFGEQVARIFQDFSPARAALLLLALMAWLSLAWGAQALVTRLRSRAT